MNWKKWTIKNQKKTQLDFNDFNWFVCKKFSYLLIIIIPSSNFYIYRDWLQLMLLPLNVNTSLYEVYKLLAEALNVFPTACSQSGINIFFLIF